MTSRIRALVVGPLAVSVLALSACSQGSDSNSAVPELSKSKSTSTANSDKASDSGRPRYRLDMSGEEKNRLVKAYGKCEAAHGYDGQPKPGWQAAKTKAERACRTKKPLPEWEYDANNPKAEEFVHELVQCLRRKGVKYVDEASPKDGQYNVEFGGSGNDEESTDKGMTYLPKCEKRVADKGIGR